MSTPCSSATARPASPAPSSTACPTCKLIAEVEGDRFSQRIDVDAAAARHITVVDTTNGSSYPVSEWALAMAMIGLRNAGALYRRMIAGETPFKTNDDRVADFSWNGELTGKSVGLIGCGYIGRRLLELLAPFHCDIYAFDPHVPRVLADIYDITLTSLDARDGLRRGDLARPAHPRNPGHDHRDASSTCSAPAPSSSTSRAAPSSISPP